MMGRGFAVLCGAQSNPIYFRSARPRERSTSRIRAPRRMRRSSGWTRPPTGRIDPTLDSFNEAPEFLRDGALKSRPPVPAGVIGLYIRHIMPMN